MGEQAMMERRFMQCDVFSATPLKGNALAVVVDGDGLTDEEMQNFARWTNLAETTFLMTPDHPEADYKVRIFTPAREMPFAGHPTLGSCMAWLKSGGRPKRESQVRQQCEIGIVPIDLTAGTPAFAAPPTDIAPMPLAERERICDRLELSPDRIVNAITLNNGPVWQVFELTSASDVLNADSSKVKWPEFKAIGLIGTSHHEATTDYEVRMLAPSSGMSEDPITGSLNAALAKWLQTTDRLRKPITVSQGTNIQREGKVMIQTDQNGEVWIRGDVHIVVEGFVRI